MSMKLRDLIRAVRACKTAAEERALILKENAIIRTSFKEDSPYRHRNVAKLLYIHMLGYPTHFGQMEALKLIAGGNFPEKRIGYLGLMLLLDERAETLMLVTNSLKQDMYSKNPYIVGLALCSMGNICSAEMARDLCAEVEKFFRHQSAYIRKKAALCAIRIIRKVPELIEEFEKSVVLLLNDKNHAVLITAITLIIEMCKIDEKLIKTFRKLVPTIVRLLKNLVLAGYVSEYDVAGITDPFLQSRLIHLLRVLGSNDREASEFMNEILAQVAINTEPTKNPGNVILYETVQTIMTIEADNSLRVLAINILGRFLSNRDNNIRYVALTTLHKCVSRDTAAIQRHRNTIVECLKDLDVSIRRRALDLIYALVTKSNVKTLAKELLTYLALTSGDVEFKTDLTDKICLTGDHRVLTRRGWRSITRMQVGDEVLSFNLDTYAQEWKAVTKVTSHLIDLNDKKDTLYRMQASGMDVIATRNHRMLLARLAQTKQCRPDGLQLQTPVGYETVGDLLPPAYTYMTSKTSTNTSCSYTTSRAVVCSGHTTQPAVKIDIPDLQAVCDWWWDTDGQLGFLRFLGFWLGGGFLDVKGGHVCVTQKKEEGKAWLDQLYCEVFPGWWYKNANSADQDKFTYKVRCPPLFEWLRVMAAGPPGYNPRDPASLRSYPHFVPAPAQPAGAPGPAQRPLAEVEAQSGYGRTRIAPHVWTEEEMLAAFNAHAPPSPRRSSVFTAFTESPSPSSASISSSSSSSSFTFTPHRRSISAVSTESMADGIAAAAAMEDEEDEEDGKADRKEVAQTISASDEEEEEEEEGTPPEVMGDDEVEIPRVTAIVDDEAAEAARVAGKIVWWNNGEWIIINGHWFYLKRWLGGQQQLIDRWSRLSREQAVALLDGFCRADGRCASVQYEVIDGRREPTGSWECSNSSFPLIDHLQLIAQLAGAAVDLRLHTKGGKTTSIDGRTVTFTVDHWLLAFSFTKSMRGIPFQHALLAQPVDVSNNIDARGYYQYEEDGRVYCVSVDSDIKGTTANFLTQRIANKRIASNKTGLGVRAHSVFVGNCLVVEKYAPSKQWHIETIIAVLSTAGSLTQENVSTDLILLISRSPALHPYAVYKLFFAIRKGSPHLPLIHVAIWCIGEYGDYLISRDGADKAKEADSAVVEEPVTERMILDVLRAVKDSKESSLLTREYLLNAMIKLSSRLSEVVDELKRLMSEYEASVSVELQQRSCEYRVLTSEKLSKIRNGVVARMPVPTKQTKKQRETERKEKEAKEKEESRGREDRKKKPKHDDGEEDDEDEDDDEEEEDEEEDDDEEDEEGAEIATKKIEIPKSNGKPVKKAAAPPPTAKAAPKPLLDLDSLFGGPATTSTSPTPGVSHQANRSVELLDIFGSPPLSSSKPVAAISSMDPFAALGGSPAPVTPAAAPPSSVSPAPNFFSAAPAVVSSPSSSSSVQSFPPAVVFEKDGLAVTFQYSRAPSNPALLSVTAVFSNRTNSDFTSFDFQVAVAKNVVTLAMQPATSAVIPAKSENRVKQDLTLNNSLHGQKRLAIKIRITYQTEGRAVVETATINQFPD